MALSALGIGLICAAIVVLIILLVICCLCCRRKGSRARHTRDAVDGKSFPGQRTVARRHPDGKTIDLHQLSLRDAMAETEKFVKEMESEYCDKGYKRKDRMFYIITGRGLHSKDGQPVLKPNVENFLKGKGYQYGFSNPGMIQVDLSNRKTCRVQMW